MKTPRFYCEDYDTNETVTCQSYFLYDEERQRSLQHYIHIGHLPAVYNEVVLPSGGYISPMCIKSINDHHQEPMQLAGLRCTLRGSRHSS